MPRISKIKLNFRNKNKSSKIIIVSILTEEKKNPSLKITNNQTRGIKGPFLLAKKMFDRDQYA